MKSQARVWSAAAVCLLLLVLIGCAPSGTGASPGTSPATTPTATTTPAPGSAGLNGCSSQTPPTNIGAPADVSAGPGGTPAKAVLVSLNKGQTLEVRLTATVRWMLNMQGDQTILTPASPNGWYDASTKNCVWRFTAVSQGYVTLSFSGGLVCAPNTACPALASVQGYDVTVQ